MQDSDCGSNALCNLCPPTVELCIAPIAPAWALAPGVCKKKLSPCTFTEDPGVCGPLDSYDLSPGPGWMAYDGTNIWFTDLTDDLVTELSPGGDVIGSFLAGKWPAGIAFDGVHMWVVNNGDSTVTELSPKGEALGTFHVGSSPSGIAFDGTNMWVANTLDGTVTVLSPSGKTVGTYDAGSGAFEIAFDGTNMWTTRLAPGPGLIVKLSPSGKTIGAYSTPGGATPESLAFDGTHMWITYAGLSSAPGFGLLQLALDGTQLSTRSITVTGERGVLAFDGTNLWLADGNTVMKLRSGAPVETFALDGALGPVVFDGAHLWVATNTGTATGITEL